MKNLFNICHLAAPYAQNEKVFSEIEGFTLDIYGFTKARRKVEKSRSCIFMRRQVIPFQTERYLPAQ